MAFRTGWPTGAAKAGLKAPPLAPVAYEPGLKGATWALPRERAGDPLAPVRNTNQG